MGWAMDKSVGLVSQSRSAFRLKRAVKAGLVLAACVGLALGIQPGFAQKKSLAMLDQLDRGEWELRGLGEDIGKMCLRTGRDLIQLRHRNDVCTNVVVDDKPNEITVQYTCAGQGYGRTHVRRETNALIQIDSQGIAHGQPFAFATEGRRIGGCGG